MIKFNKKNKHCKLILMKTKRKNLFKKKKEEEENV